jgi:GT2 family glycosyltransferase
VSRADRRFVPGATSVVVVTYNDVELTRACLAALEAQRPAPLEIIVVDNGSQTDVIGPLRADCPDAHFSRLEANTGFAGGYNHGIRRARGEYVAIINNDATADAEWLAHLLAEMTRDPRAGAVASLVLDGARPDRIDSLGMGIALDGMARQRYRGEREDDVRTGDAAAGLLLFSGSACLFRRAALDDVGLFDESFFAYCEDTDLNLRLLWAGWRVRLAADARVLHRYSATGGAFSSRKVFLVERNHFWVAVKCLPAPLLALLPFTTLWRYWLQLRTVRRQDSDLHLFVQGASTFRLTLGVLTAYAACTAGLPRVWRQRREIMRTRRVSRVAMLWRLARHRLPMRSVL